MKFTAALLALVGLAAASPLPIETVEEPAELINLEKRASLNYVQNYNGNLANL